MTAKPHNETFEQWAERRGGIPPKMMPIAREAWDAAMSVVKADNMVVRTRLGVTNVCHRLHTNLKRKPINIQKALWDVEFLQVSLAEWRDSSTGHYSSHLKEMVLDVLSRAAKDERLLTGKQFTDAESVDTQ